MAVFYVVETAFELSFLRRTLSHVNTYFKRKHSKCPPPPPWSGFGRLSDVTVKHRMNSECPQPNKHLIPKKELLFFLFTGPVSRLVDFSFIFMSLQTCIFSFADREMLVACFQMHGYHFLPGEVVAAHSTLFCPGAVGHLWKKLEVWGSAGTSLGDRPGGW